METSNRMPFFKAITLILMLFLPFYDVFVLTPVFTDFVVDSLEQDARQTAGHLTKMISVDSDEIALTSIGEKLSEEAGGFLEDFNIKKVKVFSRAGKIIFSTAKEDIGRNHPDSKLWQKLSAGQTYSKAIKANRFSLEGDVFTSDIVETYVPLIRQQKLIGAIEIYSDISQRRHALKKLSFKLHLLIIAAMLLLGAVFLVANEKENKHLKEQQKTRNQLLLAKEEWENTFDSIEDNIAIIDLDLNITRINKAGREKLGLPYDKIIGQKCYKLLRHKDDLCEDCRIADVLREETPQHCERESLFGGSIMSITISPLFDHDNNVEGFVHIARDISRQKKLEQQMISNQKMEALAVLTTGVAHNFRNVLARILMNSQVLQGSYPDDVKINEVTSWINEAVDSGSRLVKNLMQFSRRKIREEYQPIDLVKVIPDAYELLRSSMGKKVDFSFDGPESLAIKGEYSAILQVLINICTNGVDAMPDGGKLHIHLARKEENALIVISDTGKGIDEAVLNKVFEPFFTTKDVDKGTGLGLSSSYGIISEHGGDITASSEPGKGTTFTITLPLWEMDPDDSQITTLEEIENSLARRIMVIDDEEHALIPMTRLLENSGYETSGTTDSTTALGKIKEWRPELVFVDFNMPGKDGLTLSEEINKLDPSIKIILLSGSALEDLGINLRDPKYAFINRAITKPVGIDELTKAIERAFSS